MLLACVSAIAAEVRVNETGQIVAQATDMRVFRGEGVTPMFGTVVKGQGHARFVPALPLVAGETYRVEFRKSDGPWITQHLRMELSKTAVPSVSIAPKPTVLPANALKLYLQFSHPMEQGVFLDRITLHRQDGSIIDGALRETELWSPDGTRLTLWLHPGRQKTGVNLNTDEGPVLRAGETHTLKVAANWRSDQGVALGKETAFTLTAGAVDHTCPDPQRWQLTAPKTGTREPLTVQFDEALDPAMLVSALTVKQGENTVAGTVQVAADARSWSFTPAGDWQPGPHALHIDPLLEDLAGNNLLGPFEVDRDAAVKPAQETTLRFEARR